MIMKIRDYYLLSHPKSFLYIVAKPTDTLTKASLDNSGKQENSLSGGKLHSLVKISVIRNLQSQSKRKKRKIIKQILLVERLFLQLLLLNIESDDED